MNKNIDAKSFKDQCDEFRFCNNCMITTCSQCEYFFNSRQPEIDQLNAKIAELEKENLELKYRIHTMRNCENCENSMFCCECHNLSEWSDGK